MSFLSLFRSQPKGSADHAKERLQLIVAHRRAGFNDQPLFMPELQKELMAVIRKFVNVPDDAVKIDMDRDGETELLELNITVPDRV